MMMTLLSLTLAAVLGMQETPKETTDRLIRDLGAADVETRETAERELRKIGRPAIPELQKVLGDTDWKRAELASQLILEIEKGDGGVAWDDATLPQDQDAQKNLAIKLAVRLAIKDPLRVGQAFARRPLLADVVAPAEPPAVPQEVKRDEKAAEEVTEALRKTASASFNFTGKVESASTVPPGPGDGVLRVLGMGGKGDPLSGKMSGAVAAPFRAAVRVKLADGSYEMFHKGDRTMERVTGRAGAIQAPLEAAPQALALLDLEGMARSVEKFATRVEAGEDAVADDTKCRRFEITLPDEAIPVIESPDDDAVMAVLRQQSKPGKTVDVTVWVGAGDGQVRRLQAAFHYKPRHNGQGFTGDIKYDLALDKHGAAQVAIPADAAQD